MHRVADMVSQQISMHCVQMRVEAAAVSNGLPAAEVTCSSCDAVSEVLSCACARFGVDVGEWRLFKDKHLTQQLPLDATLESCSISGHALLFLG
jgi:hypothetical protein